MDRIRGASTHEARRGAILMLGAMWGAWHFLAIWWGSAESFGSVPVAIYILGALFSFLPPYRILMVRVYKKTGSLLVAVLMHASLTSSMLIMAPAVNGIDSVLYNLAFSGLLWCLVAIVGVAWHRVSGSVISRRTT